MASAAGMVEKETTDRPFGEAVNISAAHTQTLNKSRKPVNLSSARPVNRQESDKKEDGIPIEFRWFSDNGFRPRFGR
jgi:hypothetical protein